MNFIPTPFDDAYLIELDRKEDHRGYYARAFCFREFEKIGLDGRIAQANISYSKEKFTLRGFHYQVDGDEEAKTIGCLAGRIWDVIIDIRPDSSTYCQYYGVELSAKNKNFLHLPKGFAHAFLSLEPNCEALYFASQFYSPGNEKGIRWNDPLFDIPWPTSQPIISEKDATWPDFKAEARDELLKDILPPAGRQNILK